MLIKKIGHFWRKKNENFQWDSHTKIKRNLQSTYHFMEKFIIA